MRLTWSDQSIDDLRELHDRAPVQARRVHTLTEGLRDLPFPGMYRRVEERPGEHALSVPPHAVFYVVEGDSMTVLRIVDSRRRQKPW